MKSAVLEDFADRKKCFQILLLNPNLECLQEHAGRLRPRGADREGAERAHGLAAVDRPDLGAAPEEGRRGLEGAPGRAEQGQGISRHNLNDVGLD